jgi:hypothetical protein
MKFTRSRITLSLAALVTLIPSLHAQSVYAAKQYFRIQAGAGGMYLDNDYTNRSAKGVAVWGDVDFTHYKSLMIGAEVEAHFGGIITPDDIGENSYLVGPRVSYTKRRFTVYGKLMVGRATITNQDLNLSSSYNVLPAFGGGLEYRVSRHWNIRAVDIEVQKWPDFEPTTLSPFSVAVGASYIIR